VSKTTRDPSILQALAPLLFLVAALVCAVNLFDDTAYGPNQVALMLASGVAAWSACATASPGRTSRTAWCTECPWRWCRSSSCCRSAP
jgi:hypothetical protein